MRSPREKAEKIDHLIKMFNQNFDIFDIHPWHIFSMYYAVICAQMKPWWQKTSGLLVPILYKMDKKIGSKDWYQYLDTWPLIGVKAFKKKPLD
jgi:hypothetical protein